MPTDNDDGEIDNVDEGELDDLYEAAFHRPADGWRNSISVVI